MSLHAIEPQQLRRQRRVLAWNLHAIEQTQSRGRRRVDGVGRLRLISTQVQLRRTHGVQAEAAPIGDVRPGFLPAVLASCRPLVPARHCVEIKAHGAFVLSCRVVLHAIDATPARWRGDTGSSPLDRARTAASSPRNDLAKNCRAPDTLVDFHPGATWPTSATK